MDYLLISLQSAGAGSNMGIYIIAMFAIMYFFMIRPQMRRQKKERNYRQAIKKGDKVVTTSGMHGKVVDLIDKDNTCIIETTAGRIKFERSAISMELSKKYLQAAAKK